MIDPDRGVLALLDDAATWLLAAGCSDPFQTAPAMRLQCLWAAGRLQLVGARPHRSWTPAPPESLPGIIVVALAVLTLPPAELADPGAVADAQQALHTALQKLV